MTVKTPNTTRTKAAKTTATRNYTVEVVEAVFNPKHFYCGYFKPAFDWVLGLTVDPASNTRFVTVLMPDTKASKAIKIRTLYVRLGCSSLVSNNRNSQVAQINGLFVNIVDGEEVYFCDERLRTRGFRKDSGQLGELLKLTERTAMIVDVEETEAELIIYLLAQDATKEKEFERIARYKYSFMAQVDIPARILNSYNKLFRGKFLTDDLMASETIDPFSLHVRFKNPTYLEWYCEIIANLWSRRELENMLFDLADVPFNTDGPPVEVSATQLLIAVVLKHSAITFDKDEVTPAELREINPEIFELAELVIKNDQARTEHAAKWLDKAPRGTE